MSMNWLDRYKSKVRTADEALKVIRSGQRVYVQPGCAMPEVLVDAMCNRYLELENVEVIHLLTVGRTKYSLPEMEGHFRHNALFIGKNVREAVNDGRADFTPVFLSEIPDLFPRMSTVFAASASASNVQNPRRKSQRSLSHK
jgi:acyl-CoA hydrolase